MKYLPRNYGTMDVSEVVGEVKVEERSNVNGGLASLVKKHAFGFSIGFVEGIVYYGSADHGKESTIEILSFNALCLAVTAGYCGFCNNLRGEQVLPVKIPSTMLGLFVGSMIGKYCLQ